MKKNTEHMKKSIRKIVCLVLLIVLPLPLFSQELTIVAQRKYSLNDCTPNPFFRRGNYISKERGDEVNIGDTITIYAFHSSMDWTFVYNQKKTGYIWYIKNTDKNLYKQIKKAKVWDYFENSHEIWDKQHEILAAINDYYNRLADAYDREVFVKDSLEKRRKFVADSIQQREQFVRDSLAKVEKHRQDSIEWRERLKQIELEKSENIELFKSMNPFMMDITHWFVDRYETMSLGVEFYNCSNKTIKYVTFKGRFFNRVHDLIREMRTGTYTWSAKGIGPIYPAPRTLEEYDNSEGKYGGKIDFKNLYYFYPGNITYMIEVTSVKIEYMDGTIRTITGRELEKHVTYSCHQ